jgi:hypothetical protein
VLGVACCLGWANRESARRGARGFLISYFSIFLQLKFQPFNYLCFTFSFCFSRHFFIGLVVCITLQELKDRQQLNREMFLVFVWGFLESGFWIFLEEKF